MEKKSSKSIALFCVMVLVLFTFPARAQDRDKVQGGFDSQPDEPVYGSRIVGDDEPTYGSLILNNELLIINGDADKISFLLSNGEKGEPVRFELGAYKRSTFHNATHISVETTTSSYVTYRIYYGDRYVIYKNQRTSRLDVRTLRRR